MTDSQLTLQVQVLSPETTLFAGPALSVSSKNSSGNFDLLPQHANLITFIDNNSIVIRKPNQEKVNFKFPFAIIYITNDQVTIYAQPR